jgi:hypothetical protein
MGAFAPNGGYGLPRGFAPRNDESLTVCDVSVLLARVSLSLARVSSSLARVFPSLANVSPPLAHLSPSLDGRHEHVVRFSPATLPPYARLARRASAIRQDLSAVLNRR